MKPLFITENDVKDLVSVAETVDVLDRAFLEANATGLGSMFRSANR